MKFWRWVGLLAGSSDTAHGRSADAVVLSTAVTKATVGFEALQSKIDISNFPATFKRDIARSLFISIGSQLKGMIIRNPGAIGG